VAGLLEDLAIQRLGVAVAVNRTVVPQAQHGSSRLKPSDQVEIIRAVGGG
jgi:sulfur carrier protein